MPLCYRRFALVLNLKFDSSAAKTINMNHRLNGDSLCLDHEDAAKNTN
jgi:hypothetical protein